MQYECGRWHCSECGAVVLGVPSDAQWRVEMVGAAGSPNVRVVVVDRHEVHHCAAPDARRWVGYRPARRWSRAA